MNRAEAAELLTYMSMSDNRDVSESAATNLADILDDITLTDAMSAVKHHYRNESRWVMPADIRRIVREQRESVDLRQIPMPDPPSALADYPQVEAQWRLTYQRAIADGADEPTARRIACRAHDVPDDERPELNPDAARELTQAVTDIATAKRSRHAKPQETA